QAADPVYGPLCWSEENGLARSIAPAFPPLASRAAQSFFAGSVRAGGSVTLRACAGDKCTTEGTDYNVRAHAAYQTEPWVAPLLLVQLGAGFPASETQSLERISGPLGPDSLFRVGAEHESPSAILGVSLGARLMNLQVTVGTNLWGNKLEAARYWYLSLGAR